MKVHFPNAPEIFTFLAISAIIVPILNRFKVPPILSFLLIGIGIGPYGMGRFIEDWPWLSYIVYEDIEGVRLIAELGILFLLFAIGLELSFKKLWSMRRLVFGLGSMQLCFTGLIIAGFAYAWGNGPEASIIIGLSLALSSTAMVIKLLSDHHDFTSPAGQASFSVLLFQDLAVVPVIFLTTVFTSDTDDGSILITLLVTFMKASAVIAAIILAGRYIIRPGFQILTRSAKGSEFFMAQVLLLLLFIAWVTGHGGLSMALGAFLAGLIMSETAWRNQIEIDIAPFKGLFLGLFFIGVGMGIDLYAVANNILWVCLSVVGLITIKTGALFICCRLFKLPMPVLLQTSVSLSQAGEFGFIILGLAATGGLIAQDIVQFMLIVTSLTMLITPFLYAAGRGLPNLLIKRPENPQDQAVLSYTQKTGNHVVIAGFGRTGQTIANCLDEQDIPYLALELNPHALEYLRNNGKPVFFGDASQIRALEKVNTQNARAVIVAIDTQKDRIKTIEGIRRHYPDIPIIARAYDSIQADYLKKRGATHTVLETHAMARELAEQVTQLA